jgi:hypothetical protein
MGKPFLNGGCGRHQEIRAAYLQVLQLEPFRDIDQEIRFLPG